MYNRFEIIPKPFLSVREGTLKFRLDLKKLGSKVVTSLLCGYLSIKKVVDSNFFTKKKLRQDFFIQKFV